MKKDAVTWVVYLMTIHNRIDKLMAVCEQSEWDAMELSRPGYHQLVRGGISNEVEAEMIARGPTENVIAGPARVLNFALDSPAV